MFNYRNKIGEIIMNGEAREDLKMLEERVKSAINMAQNCDIDFIYHERPVYEIQRRQETRNLKSKDEYLNQRFGALFRDYGLAFTFYVSHCQCSRTTPP